MPGSAGAGVPGTTGGTGGLYQWQPPNPQGVSTLPPSHHRHHGMHGLGDWGGGLGAFDPLGIGIDFSDPTVLLITGAVVYFLFFHKKGRKRGLF